MKKYIGALCSGIASILTFVFLALPAWAMERVYASVTFGESFSGYQLISGKAGDVDLTELEIGALSRYRIFAIILLVLAVILALYTIVMILANLKVIKLNAGLISLINNVLLIVITVVSVLALTAVLSINGDIASELHTTVDDLKKMYDTIGTQIGLWLVVAVNAIACATSWVFSALKGKNK